VRSREALDPASANALVRALLARFAEASPNTPPPSEAQLASMKLERTTECRYEMDTGTGLAAKTDCTSTIGAIDEAMKPAIRTDRWVITQTLKTP
jgi:hypothetical protein